MIGQILQAQSFEGQDFEFRHEYASDIENDILIFLTASPIIVLVTNYLIRYQYVFPDETKQRQEYIYWDD